MKNRNIKVGVVGFAGRAGYVAHIARSMLQGLFETVACVEIDETNYERGCEAFNCRPRCYNSVRAMVEAGGIDGVMIGTPNAFHLENLLDLRGSGLPVFLEKPLDATWEKICETVRFSDTYPQPILVGHCMRYAPIINKAAELVQAGAIGRVLSFRGVQNCNHGNVMFHNWRRNLKQSGSNWVEKATHDLDVLFALMRTKPTRLYAISKIQAFGGDMPNDLHCDVCYQRIECPESMGNIRNRQESHVLPQETKGGKKHFCVFASEADTWDNQACLMQLQDGGFGEYSECYFTPQNYHHRVYELRGNQGVLEIKLGKHEGDIHLAPRYGANKDGHVFHFDYLGRNHYNGDHCMARHIYNVFLGETQPLTTIKQAFVAETAGYAAVCSSKEDTCLDIESLLPPDLQSVWNQPLWPQ